MQNRSNLENTQSIYDAFSRGDLQFVIAACAEDIDWQLFIPPEIPYSGRYRGRGELADYFRKFADAAQIEEFEIHEFIVGEDAVVVLGWDRVSVKSTGRHFEMNWAHVYHFRDGKVVRFREYFDTTPMFAAFRS